MTWIRVPLLAVALALLAQPSSQAEELPCVPSKFALKYICVCPTPCPKCAPSMDWKWCSTCDNYCKKCLPCPPTPCLKFVCDTYDCKPVPCCYPKSPCPIR